MKFDAFKLLNNEGSHMEFFLRAYQMFEVIADRENREHSHE